MTMAPTARSSSTIDSTLTTSRINISTRSSRSNYVIPMGGLLRTVSLTDKRVVVLGFILLSLLTYWIPLVYKGTELGEDAYFKNSELIMKSITKLFTRIDKRSVSVNGSKTVSDINQNQYSSVTSDLESIYGDEFTVHECEKSLYKEPGSMPKFIVAGVHKGGSTALYGYLTRHGHVRPSCCKEINFFTIDKIYRRGFEYYLRHFPNLTYSPHIITGEGTPNYIRDPYAPKRISKLLPKIKVVISLRDPVERLISHFVGQLENAKARKQKPIKNCDEFMNSNFKRIEKCAKENVEKYKQELSDSNVSKTLNNGELVVGLPKAHCSLGNQSVCLYHYCFSRKYELPLSRSVYVDQLERWLMYFPPEQILIVQAEHLFKYTEDTMQDVAEFLGLRRFVDSELEYFHSTFKGSSHMKNPVSEKCNRTLLREFFRPYNQRLYALLQKRWTRLSTKWEPWEDLYI